MHEQDVWQLYSDNFVGKIKALNVFSTYINCLHSIACDVSVQAHLPSFSVMHAHAATVGLELV